MYEARTNCKFNRTEIGMMIFIPGSGKLLGRYKRRQDAAAALTRHRRKHPYAREMRIDFVPQ